MKQTINEIEIELAKAKQSAYEDILNYLSDRGFRESNYEIIELTKWLRNKIKNSERRYE